ncbi:MAG: hypothetical protein K6U14_06400 [Firmicutes bacterium]|nr:hypothetical protein [Alicyclobacillaceae bacterium]MCL6497250.1 hypothetical protein [Bacillota bacterium]
MRGHESWRFTDRECAVLQLLSQQADLTEMAAALGVSTAMVRRYVRRIGEKLLPAPRGFPSGSRAGPARLVDSAAFYALARDLQLRGRAAGTPWAVAALAPTEGEEAIALAITVRPWLRRSDQLATIDGLAWILLPETSAAGAKAALGRLSSRLVARGQGWGLAIEVGNNTAPLAEFLPQVGQKARQAGLALAARRMLARHLDPDA